jgi:multidrug efflux pump subunit AcrB
MVRLASSVPGVSHTVEFTGFSGLDGTNRSNAVTTFLVLAPFEERKKDPKENGFAILAEVQRRFATLQKGRALVFPPPPVQGIGNAGGFKLQVEDRRAAGLPALQAATDALIGKRRPRSIWRSTAAKPRRWACRSTRSSVPCRVTWGRPT